MALPLVRWTGSGRLGDWAKRQGLLLVPSETEPPAELQMSPWSPEDRGATQEGLPAVPPPEANVAG